MAREKNTSPRPGGLLMGQQGPIRDAVVLYAAHFRENHIAWTSQTASNVMRGWAYGTRQAKGKARRCNERNLIQHPLIQISFVAIGADKGFERRRYF